MGTQEPSYACQCFSGWPSENLAEADAVFAGRVVNAGVSEGARFDPWVAEFDVETVWKGYVYQTTYVFTAGPDSPCWGVDSLEKGGEYIVYAGHYDEGLWPIFCVWELSEAADDVAYLGEGEAPAVGADTPPPGMPPKTGSGCGRSPHTIALSSVGLLLGLTWLGLRRRTL